MYITIVEICVVPSKIIGDTVKGTADLSKAGELGVVAAYNLLKRMSD